MSGEELSPIIEKQRLGFTSSNLNHQDEILSMPQRWFLLNPNLSRSKKALDQLVTIKCGMHLNWYSNSA
ncbi:MAG: hypothetical protein AAF843_19155 [Bacteroidota bacterium]